MRWLSLFILAFADRNSLVSGEREVALHPSDVLFVAEQL